MKRIIYIAIIILTVSSCGNNGKYDAQGTFEATEVVVSSEAAGRILSFDVEEGMPVKAGIVVGKIDSLQLYLQHKQLSAQLSALLDSRPDTKAQVASLSEQIEKQKSELRRVKNMLNDGAATQKQYDDIEAHIRILKSQLSATLSTLNKSTATINNNAEALEAQMEALADRISKCSIISPIDGIVLVKYAEAGELATMGKPLMKIANLDKIYLRAYFTSNQLANLKLGDEVTVTADFGGTELYDYVGHITWISSESEFTPKTIQTEDSRANLVYAVKIAVENDGRLKIGLSGNVTL
ncbi:MAG: HlyD family efflux transporter periplasmic adaptor subunit [Bacteroidales bacterium]|jgi:HlyD family secretion protein|nr:HlyD family efflux transporter periplasmic adaptor subunit [Bacteroidales bacterium]